VAGINPAAFHCQRRVRGNGTSPSTFLPAARGLGRRAVLLAVSPLNAFSPPAERLPWSGRTPTYRSCPELPAMPRRAGAARGQYRSDPVTDARPDAGIRRFCRARERARRPMATWLRTSLSSRVVNIRASFAAWKNPFRRRSLLSACLKAISQSWRCHAPKCQPCHRYERSGGIIEFVGLALSTRPREQPLEHFELAERAQCMAVSNPLRAMTKDTRE
jgi:hypothetical protein